MNVEIKSRQTETHLAYQLHLCSLNPKEYRSHVDSLLEAQLDYALKHVPFYRSLPDNRTRDTSLSPTLRLRAFPTFTRKDLQSSRNEFMTEDIYMRDTILRSSSGSSGIPLGIAKDRSLFPFYSSLLTHKMISHGWTPFDTYFIMHGSGIGNITPGISTEELADLIFSARPSILYCYPSYLLNLIQLISSKKLSQLGMRFIGTHSETSTAEERECISDAFSCPVYDDYGMTEVGPIASQCCLGRYHIIEHNVSLEILDQDGLPVTPGEMGEVVVTDIRNRAMPLIRYRTGDLSTMPNTTDCTCGWRSMRQLSAIEGRKANSFQLPSGRIIPSGQLTGPLGFPSGDIVRHWQLEQSSLDTFRLRVVKGSKFNRACVDQFHDALLELFNEPIRVDVEYVTTLSPTSSKRDARFIPLDSNSTTPKSYATGARS